MDSLDLLSPRAVMLGLRVSSKKQVFEQLAERAEQVTGLNQRAVFDMLLERERLGCTGVGSGVAIPHARPAGIDRLYGLFARLEKPIPYDAPDDEDVDLIFLLLAPASEGGDHLKALARVARALRDATIRAQLRAAASPQAVIDLIASVQHAFAIFDSDVLADAAIFVDYRAVDLGGFVAPLRVMTVGPGGMVSSASDVDRWAAAFFAGSLLADSLVRQATQSQISVTPSASTIPDLEGYGFGWYVSRRYGSRVIWADGDFAGSRTLVLHAQPYGLTVTILGNRRDLLQRELAVVIADRMLSAR